MGLVRSRCSCQIACAGLDLIAAPAFSLNGVQDRTGCKVSEKRWKSETPATAGVSTRLSSTRLPSGGVSLKKTAAATRLQKLMGRHVTYRNGMSCILCRQQRFTFGRKLSVCAKSVKKSIFEPHSNCVRRTCFTHCPKDNSAFKERLLPALGDKCGLNPVTPSPIPHPPPPLSRAPSRSHTTARTPYFDCCGVPAGGRS